MESYDVVIIGAGPAGISAAIYALRKGLSTLIVSQTIGGQTMWTSEIANYPSHQVISGADLTSKFQKHLADYNADLNDGETVKEVKKAKEGGFIVVSDKASYHARTLIVASGKKPKLLAVPGEMEYKGKGVAYCAICDGPLFAGKPVAVIGGGNSAIEAVLQMEKVSPKVHIVNVAKGLTADAVLIEKCKKSDKIEVHNDSTVKRILGETLVTGIEIEQAGKTKTLDVEGVFIEIGLIPNVDFIDFAPKNEDNEIKVDCACATDVPGLFAAGDVTNVIEKQIIIAAGEGAKAALSASKYLQKNY